MESLDLMFVWLSALLAVFVLLTILAIIMRVLIAVFPETLEKLAKSDAALLAAVTTAAASLYPGMSVTRVEEEK
jgi:TRAP-type C4-dicarboxylate transport system permease small subunit